VNEVVGSVEKRLKGATEVRISGNDNAFINSASGDLDRELRRGLKVRLLGVDPDSAAAPMLSKIDPRFAEHDFRGQISAVTAVACGLRAKFPDRFEYRLLPVLPAIGYFITDPELPTKSVKIELYTAMPWAPLHSRPHFVIEDSMPDWREYFIQQFRNYWALSSSPASAKPYAPALRPL
jgi:hypothetical protein